MLEGNIQRAARAALAQGAHLEGLDAAAPDGAALRRRSTLGIDH
jgi:hypothetical protein